MTLKQTLLHSCISACLAITAALIYNSIYSAAFEVNFSKVLNTGSIIGATTCASLLMGISYYLFYNWKGVKGIGGVNVLIAVISFVSVAGVFGFKLPMDIESPELFPGLAIPMHFFPALSFLCIAPFFKWN